MTIIKSPIIRDYADIPDPTSSVIYSGSLSPISVAPVNTSPTSTTPAPVLSINNSIDPTSALTKSISAAFPNDPPVIPASQYAAVASSISNGLVPFINASDASLLESISINATQIISIQAALAALGVTVGGLVSAANAASAAKSVDNAASGATSVIGKITGAIGSTISAVEGVVTSVVGTVVKTVTNVVSSIAGTVSNVAKKIGSFIKHLF